MKKLFKKIILPVMALVTFIPFCKVNALHMEKSYYDSISWVWTYQAPYDISYNCLGWATGSMTFEWPSLWGYTATYTEVSNYIRAKGYYDSGSPAILTNGTRIIAYGPSSDDITHFAKVLNKEVTAKWGKLERFSHGQNANPYYSTSNYGMARISFTG